MFWSVIWYWLLLLFTAADIVTTKVALSHGFPYYESNPLIIPALDHLVELKVLVVAVVVASSVAYEFMYRGNGWIPLAIGACFAFIVVISNILVVVNLFIL